MVAGVVEPAVLGSGCVTSGKSLRSPSLRFLIFDLGIMTMMPTLFGDGNECAKHELLCLHSHHGCYFRQ